MSIAAGIILGLVQGLTEFLPISSSGHLVVAQHFLPGFEQPGVVFEIVLHLGTLGAVMIYFRKEVAVLFSGLRLGTEGAVGRRLIGLLIVGTIPAVVAALLFGDIIERSFEQISVVGAALCATGVMLLFSRRLARDDEQGADLLQVTPLDAAVVGIFQCVALIPGVSRSGTTIVGGLTRSFSRTTAARFSFLLSIPAILGATIYQLKEVASIPEGAMAGYAAGFLTAFAIGYVAISLVIRFLANRRFYIFGYYCLLLGGSILGYVALGLA